MAGQEHDPEALDEKKALRALVGLMAAEREDRLASNTNGARPTELILADAGLSNTEIADLLDKKRDTVQKTITRARGKDKKSMRKGQR